MLKCVLPVYVNSAGICLSCLNSNLVSLPLNSLNRLTLYSTLSVEAGHSVHLGATFYCPKQITELAPSRCWYMV